MSTPYQDASLVQKSRRQTFQIPPEPVQSVLTDRADLTLKRLAVSAGAITLVGVTAPGNFDQVFGPFDGPILTQEAEPKARVRLYVLNGSLSFETVVYPSRHSGVTNQVIAKDSALSKVYRLLYPVGGVIGLEDLT